MDWFFGGAAVGLTVGVGAVQAVSSKRKSMMDNRIEVGESHVETLCRSVSTRTDLSDVAGGFELFSSPVWFCRAGTGCWFL